MDTSTHSPGLSRFELLPGEIRNQIYTYLLSPTYISELRYAGSYPYVQLNLNFNIFLVSRKIYREAHALFYTNFGPVLLVHGIPCKRPFNIDILLFNSGVVEPYFIMRRKATLNLVRGRIVRVTVTGPVWLEENGEEKSEMVLVGWGQIEKLLRYLQLQRMEIQMQRDKKLNHLSLHFDFNDRQNILGEPLEDKAAQINAQNELLGKFVAYKSPESKHSIEGLQDPVYQAKYLSCINFPRQWYRAEALRLYDLLLPMMPNIDHFNFNFETLRISNGSSMRNQYRKFLGYIELAGMVHYAQFRAAFTSDDPEPFRSLLELGMVAHHNIEYLNIVTTYLNIFPSTSQWTYSNSTINLFREVVELYSMRTLGYPGDPYDFDIFSKEQISVCEQLIGTSLFLMGDRLAPLGYFKKSLEFATTAERRETAEYCVKLCKEAQRTNRAPTKEEERMMMEALPIKVGLLRHSVPRKFKSKHIKAERAALVEQGYPGSLLEDRFEEEEPVQDDELSGGRGLVSERIVTSERKIWLDEVEEVVD